MYKIRKKRDTVENIYRHCKVAGNCPPDVENKVEQNTLADLLLKIFGSVVYFGGLGIGTGAGTAGVRPIPEAIPTPDVNVTTDVPEVPLARPVRPSRPTTFGVRIDPISSAGNRPKVIDPSGPSIVPLSEAGIPDPTIITTGTDIGGVTDLEILTNVDTAEDINTIGGHPTIISNTDTSAAVLDVTPIEATPRRITIQQTKTNQPVYIESNLPLASDINVYVDPNYSGITIGENIELTPINTFEEFEIQEPIPQSSTPVRLFERAAGRARQLYHRIVEQAPTRNIDFLGQPSRAVTFEFENPAFADDISLTFERDLQELAAAPDPTFADVIRLDRPQFSETKEGLVRFSRLGTRGKISTRSGKLLKQKVHFFFDLSPISRPAETLELLPIGESSDTMTIIDELSRSTFINPVFEDTFPEDILANDEELEFENNHLTLLTEEDEEQLVIPTTELSTSAIPTISSDILNQTFVSYPNVPNTNIIAPDTPVVPLAVIDPFSSDYYLHPSLLKKRRKRKFSEMF